MKTRFTVASLVAIPLFAMVAMVSSSLAATTSGTSSTSQGISGGTLQLIAPPSFLNLPSAFSTIQFSSLTLNGDQQTAQANLGDLAAVDATGTGKGWNVTVSAGQFTEVLPQGSHDTPLTLPTGSLKLAPLSSITATVVNQGDQATTSTLPSGVGTAAVPIDNGSAGSTKVVTANVQSGMGAYLIAFPANALTLTLNPATTYVDTKNYATAATPYATTLSWQINVGP